MNLEPKALKQMGPTLLGISWNDGHDSIYRAKGLRLACRCAYCVDEWTRERKVKEEDLPPDLKPKAIEPVGRYALRITWSDGHDTGIYPFESLRKLCDCSACKRVS